MALGPNLLDPLASLSALPLGRRQRSARLRFRYQLDRIYPLEQPAKKERNLTICASTHTQVNSTRPLTCTQIAGQDTTTLSDQSTKNHALTILGPALKGKKMNGLGVTYFFSLSSNQRSGSNSSASGYTTVRPRLINCLDSPPTGPFVDA